MSFRSNVSAKSRRASKKALEEIGKQGVAHIRQNIGIRVQRVGGTIIRSDPYEFPRRDRSRLWNGISYNVVSKASTIEDLRFRTRARHSKWLEHGTSNMEPRPFWAKSKRQIARDARAKFKKYYAQGMKSGRIRP
jgi:hypothetical protein